MMAAIKYGANAALCVCVVVCMGLVAHFAGSVSRGRPEDTSRPVRDTSVSDPQTDTSIAPFLVAVEVHAASFGSGVSDEVHPLAQFAQLVVRP